MARKTTAQQTATPATPAQQRAALYVRVSTDEQAEAYGLDVQRARCSAAAAAKGWAVVRTYTDAGISGTLPAADRPGLAALLADAAAGLIDHVIVLALDRLARRTSLALQLIEQLAAAGVSLTSCKEALDTATPAGQFVLTMFAALAQLERDTIVERTTAGRNQRGLADGERGGRLPYGYVRVDGVAVDEQRAALVRGMFADRAAGLTLRAIAARLNSEGARTARGAAWGPSEVKRVLDHEAAYRGGLRGMSSTHRWPAILQ